MEKNNINISTMSNADLDFISSNLDSFDDFWNVNILKEEFTSPISFYLVAKIGDEIVGFAGIKKILDEAELMNIVTIKEKRHIGIASSLLESLILICKKNKIKIMNLEVNVSNSLAIKLYKKYNFKEVGLRKNYYNKCENALLMSLGIN